jgi:hypothetical protein
MALYSSPKILDFSWTTDNTAGYSWSMIEVSPPEGLFPVAQMSVRMARIDRFWRGKLDESNSYHAAEFSAVQFRAA